MTGGCSEKYKILSHRGEPQTWSGGGLDTTRLGTIWENSDELWRRIEPIFLERRPKKPIGRTAFPWRKILVAIILRMRSGCRCDQLPERYGRQSTVHNSRFSMEPEIKDFLSAYRYCEENEVEVAQNSRELLWLWSKVVELKPRTFVEIGSREGGSLFVLAHALPLQASVISIDLANGPWGHETSARSLDRVIATLLERGWDAHLIAGDSHTPGTYERLLELLAGRSIEFLFIDGDHRLQGVRQDWGLYSPLVRPGGMIALHDLVAPAGNTEVEVHRLWIHIEKGHHCESCIEEWGIGVVHV